jgi:poly(3-hydroxybutyrate) depolymerase
VSGNSNGGMFVYYLTSQMPELIKSYALIAGQPLVGTLDTGVEARESYIISLHGRSDGTLPAAGGIDDGGEWMYDSLNNTFEMFGLV